MIYDVVVIGAGPAGCSAAFDLASHGRSVLLIDKTIFPRHKACAGALTIKTIKALPFSIKPIVRQLSYDLILSKGADQKKTIKSKHPIAVMTSREEFDSYFLDQTIEAGTQFVVIDKIHGLTELHDVVVIDIGAEQIKAKFVIGADGANSIVRKLIGDSNWLRKGFAIEATVPLESKNIPYMEFDFGEVEYGYGWVFPKDDHINIGLGTISRDVTLKKEQLVNFAFRKFKTNKLDTISGSSFCFGGEEYKPHSKKIFLIGDAAGFVDPLLGEGIYNAIKSGQKAAFAIQSELSGAGLALEMYQREIVEIQRDLLRCSNSARKFYENIDLGYKALLSPITTYCIMKAFTVGLTFDQIKRHVFLLPFYSTKDICV